MDCNFIKLNCWIQSAIYTIYTHPGGPMDIPEGSSILYPHIYPHITVDRIFFPK